MKIGELRHRVSILQKGDVNTDDDGYSTEKWVAVAVVWANVKPIAGREYFQAAAVQAQHQVRFTMRYRKGIAADMRLRWDGQDYEIQGPPIDLDGRHKWLQIMGEAITSG